jgi:Arylsulfatase regulator (Fe-S oxidoreductase)
MNHGTNTTPTKAHTNGPFWTPYLVSNSIKGENYMETIKGINPIIKICEKCNFGCSYCYYSTFNHDPKRKTMSEKMVLEIVRQAAMYNKTFGDNYINICWHGGEPLLYGTERFEKLLESVTQLLNEIKIDFSYSLQTNGYLIDKEWADIFKKYGVMIGVSIDGTEEINDSQRGIDGKPVTRTILDNIQYIRDNGTFSWHIISNYEHA